jgi:hypothetical protein
MKLAIIGGRDFDDYERLCVVMKNVKSPIEAIVSGHAKGADTLAERWADDHGVEKEIYLPDWDGLGKRAGFVRNQQIIDAADAVLAFWDQKSKGTAHSIGLAKKAGKPLKIINY